MSKIITLYIFPYQRFKNTSAIFDTQNQLQDIMCENSHFVEKTFYSRSEALTLNKIFYDFIRKTNKHEFVMDFVIAMTDAGFEDEV
jgi:hypothetical protein